MPSQIISVENLSKSYLVGHKFARKERYTALRDVIGQQASRIGRSVIDMVQGRKQAQREDIEEFWALKNVSFEVQSGEVVGIIGRNGAGKSTLLKILSRITEPTNGRVTLRGRVASLLEVGTGFHPELTGRENIFLNGAILGMSRRELKDKFDEIVAFADIERFLDTPVKRYSSGMYVRLAFAVAAHLEPEILIVDEVLAVGDAEFQKKCLARMNDVAVGGRTVLFVSHNLNFIERLCRRVIHLEGGRVKGVFDNCREGINNYLKGSVEDTPGSWKNSGQSLKNETFYPISLEVTSGIAEIQSRASFSNEYPIEVRLEFEILEEDPALNVGIALYDEQGSLIFWSFIKDVNEADWPELHRGTKQFALQLPARWVNEGVYRIEFLAALHCREWFLEPGVNAPSVTFEIQGGLSDSPYWHFRRPGLCAPVLPWQRVEHDLGSSKSEPSATLRSTFNSI